MRGDGGVGSSHVGSLHGVMGTFAGSYSASTAQLHPYDEALAIATQDPYIGRNKSST